MDQNSSGSGSIRPMLLTILCYLTMFSSSWTIMSDFATLGNPEQISIDFSKQLHQFEDQFSSDPKLAEQLENTISKIASSNTSTNMRDNAAFSLISNILTFIGAMLMLRLRRNGFKFYVLGSVIGIAAPLVVFGPSSMLGLAFAFYLAFFGTIMVIMYAFKLKYLQ